MSRSERRRFQIASALLIFSVSQATPLYPADGSVTTIEETYARSGRKLPGRLPVIREKAIRGTGGLKQGDSTAFSSLLENNPEAKVLIVNNLGGNAEEA